MPSPCEVSARERRPPRRLPVVHFEIVDGCQLRCIGCPNSTWIRKPDFIAPELFARCLGNLDVRRVELLRLFNYGEPLLHPELETLGRILRDACPFEIGTLELSTNAQSNANERLEALAALGVLGRLVVSCDGDGTPASYEALRPPSKWSKLIAFLGFARDLKQRYPALKLLARCVIEGPADAARWREVLAPFGVRPEFRGWMNLPDGKENRTGQPFRMGQGICFYASGRYGLYVSHRGEVLPCCVHPRAAVLGSLADSKFSAIYSGEARGDFLDAMANRRAQMPVCGRCDFGPFQDPGPSVVSVLKFGSRLQ